MKKVLLLSLMIVFVFTATSLYAAEKYSLGMGHIALKVDYISFTDDVLQSLDLEDGVYVGLEGYYGIMPNLYLGLESGWGGTSHDEHTNFLGDVSKAEVDVNFVPIELNMKYAIEVLPSLVVALGAGVSYSWFDIEVDITDFGEEKADDWVWGGQVFADINYMLSKQLFIGLNGKYQWTEDMEFGISGEDIKTDTSAENWRAGMQVGLMF